MKKRLLGNHDFFIKSGKCDIFRQDSLPNLVSLVLKMLKEGKSNDLLLTSPNDIDDYEVDKEDSFGNEESDGKDPNEEMETERFPILRAAILSTDQLLLGLSYFPLSIFVKVPQNPPMKILNLCVYSTQKLNNLLYRMSFLIYTTNILIYT